MRPLARALEMGIGPFQNDLFGEWGKLLANLRPFTEEEILQWAELHFHRTGCWPKYYSGPILDAPGETWGAVENALRFGRRGMAGGSSLAKLLNSVRKSDSTAAKG